MAPGKLFLSSLYHARGDGSRGARSEAAARLDASLSSLQIDKASIGYLIHTKHFHDLVTQMVDHLYGDATALRFVERR